MLCIHLNKISDAENSPNLQSSHSVLSDNTVCFLESYLLAYFNLTTFEYQVVLYSCFGFIQWHGTL